MPRLLGTDHSALTVGHWLLGTLAVCSGLTVVGNLVPKLTCLFELSYLAVGAGDLPMLLMHCLTEPLILLEQPHGLGHRLIVFLFESGHLVKLLNQQPVTLDPLRFCTC